MKTVPVGPHHWMKVLGKRSVHLILRPAKEELAWRHTACGQFVFPSSDPPEGRKCMACLRTNAGRDAERRNEQS